MSFAVSMNISPKVFYEVRNMIDHRVRFCNDPLWTMLRVHNDRDQAAHLISTGECTVTPQHLLAAVFEVDHRFFCWLLARGGDVNGMVVGRPIIDFVLHEHAQNVRAQDITKITFAYHTRKCLYAMLKQEKIIIAHDHLQLAIELGEPDLVNRLLLRYSGPIEKAVLMLALHQHSVTMFERLVRRYGPLDRDHESEVPLLASVVASWAMPVRTVQFLLRRGARPNCHLRGVHALELAFSQQEIATMLHLTVAGGHLSPSDYARLRAGGHSLPIIDDFKAFVFLRLGFRTRPGRGVRRVWPRDIIVLIQRMLARMVCIELQLSPF